MSNDANTITVLKSSVIPATSLADYNPGTGHLAIDAVTAVMQWANANANGVVGAIPTFENADDDPTQWEILSIMDGVDGIDVLTAAPSDVMAYAPTGTSDKVHLWAGAANGYAQAQGYAFCIPMDQMKGKTKTNLLAFSSSCPGLASPSVSLIDLYRSTGQTQSLVDFRTGSPLAYLAAAWAANANFGLGWPSWTPGKTMTIFCLRETALAAAPTRTDERQTDVTNLLSYASSKLSQAMLQSATLVDALQTPLEEATITDPGLTAAFDILTTAVNAVLNLVPEVGGAMSAIFSGAQSSIQSAIQDSGGLSGPEPFSAYDYIQGLFATGDAIETAIDAVHDSLDNDPATAWTTTWLDPFTGTNIELGQLANVDSTWFDEATWDGIIQPYQDAVITGFVQQVVEQNFTLVYRSYDNSEAHKQRFDQVEDGYQYNQPGGSYSKYIAKHESNYSCWFPSNPTIDDGYVYADEWWMGSLEDGPTIYADKEPAGDTTQAIFESDGYGTSDTGSSVGLDYIGEWQGFVDKQAVYQSWYAVRQLVEYTQLSNQIVELWQYGSSDSDDIVTYSTGEWVFPPEGSQYWQITETASTSASGALSGSAPSNINARIAWS